MAEREHDRMPYSVQVEFRTPSSFLVAYSVNLSRGGLFLETDADIPSGAPVTVDFSIPTAGQVSVNGAVTWRRISDGHDGPPGLGIEFTDIAPQLGAIIDRLVSAFHGVQVLVLCGDRQDRTTLSRSIKSIITSFSLTRAAVRIFQSYKRGPCERNCATDSFPSAKFPCMASASLIPISMPPWASPVGGNHEESRRHRLRAWQARVSVACDAHHSGNRSHGNEQSSRQTPEGFTRLIEALQHHVEAGRPA